MSGKSRNVVLITGGAGFVGCNLAAELLQRGETVRVLDCLARAGSEKNMRWLRGKYPHQLEFVQGELSDRQLLEELLGGVNHVYHLAAQVAVTSSMTDPRRDFEINALGTFNLLECIRRAPKPPSLLFSSTNKVYGVLPDVDVRPRGNRYVPVDEHLRMHGIDERRSLDFHSPYGCSKGAADQYVLDYSRSFGLRAAVFRMSCIYGPHQHGTEDQGWVAHFTRRALAGEPVAIYGDGMQVRDALFVTDLVSAFESARRSIDAVRGQAFNIGGGVGNTLSILELLERLEHLTGHGVDVSFDRWRTGDQRYYVSDIRKFTAATGWLPLVRIDEGLSALHEWLRSQKAGGARRRSDRAALSAGAS